MKLHVECLPDETLLLNLGFSQRIITHHSGKSRVFAKLKTSRNEIAMVDEDPATAKTDYERKLTLVADSLGIKKYEDEKGNKVLVLKIKLEDWLISACKASDIDIKNFGLPARPNDLHNVIIQRISNLIKLIDCLKKANNKHLNKLKSWLI